MCLAVDFFHVAPFYFEMFFFLFFFSSPVDPSRRRRQLGGGRRLGPAPSGGYLSPPVYPDWDV